MTEKFLLQIDGATIAGETVGNTVNSNDANRDTIIFLHAGVADRRMWAPQLAALQAEHRLLAYDLRGFGETTCQDVPFSHIADLEKIMEHFGLSEATLVGCSQGGRTALDFSLANPQRVKKLVLIAPAVSGSPPPETIPTEIEARLEALDAAEEADDLDLVNELEAQLWLDGPTSKAGRVGGELRKLFLDMNGIALRMPELTQEQEPASAHDRLSSLIIPTMVLCGELDFPHIQDRCRYLADTIPNAAGKSIPETAHLLNLEKPDVVNEILRRFVS